MDGVGTRVGAVVGRDPATGAGLRVEVSAGPDRTLITAVEPTPATESDLFLAPGLIDLQVNGFDGHDVNAADPDPSVMVAITTALSELGVTTWCPTVITGSPAAMLARLDAVATAIRTEPTVARAVPGVHVEGPYLSDREGARGVHDPTQIRPIDLAEIDRWQRVVAIAMITISPHDDHALALVPEIRARGVVVAIGHTHAAPEQITAAVDAGATVSTHLGNGIPPVLPRHPNPIWSQLADDRLTAGLIADGHHLPAEVLEVMLRAKGPGRTFLVSDATELAGRPPGRYETTVGGTVELSSTGRLSYVGGDLLAGAALPVSAGLRHLVARTSLSLAEALPLVTSTPAGLLGPRAAGRGRLEVGAPADLVLIDEAGAVHRVLLDGRWLDRRPR